MARDSNSLSSKLSSLYTYPLPCNYIVRPGFMQICDVLSMVHTCEIRSSTNTRNLNNKVKDKGTLRCACTVPSHCTLVFPLPHPLLFKIMSYACACSYFASVNQALDFQWTQNMQYVSKIDNYIQMKNQELCNQESIVCHSFKKKPENQFEILQNDVLCTMWDSKPF